MRVDLATIVVEWHEQIGCKNVSLMFDLSIPGIPTHNILLAASNAVRVRVAMD